MKKRFFISLVLIMLLFLLQIGCAKFSAEPPEEEWKPPEHHEGDHEADDRVGEPIDLIRAEIGRMSVDEKIGQLVMVGVDGYTVDEQVKEMIHQEYVGGFILFKKNVKDTQQLLQLLNDLKQENRGHKVPLFLAVDEEGGRVSRMPDEFVDIPSSREIGKVNNPQFSYEVGRGIGGAIKALGFNLDFAPVLDINSNPKNPVIGDRSFGADAELVRSLGVQTMKGLQSEQIIPVVKHFPGHGDTLTDSHVGLPRLDHDLDRLQSMELIPFQEAIERGADAVMIAHILLPKLDEKNPASFSKAIITDLLRNELHFDGVVFTDDFTMGAITENFDIGEAAVKSILAGSDVILVCHDYDKMKVVLGALKAAVAEGRIDEERIDQSLYRILQLKRKYQLADESIDAVDVDSINTDLGGILDRYMKQ